MPGWAILLIKLAASVAISLLKNTGFGKAAAKLEQKAIAKAVEGIESAKTYDEYPTGKNGQ